MTTASIVTYCTSPLQMEQVLACVLQADIAQLYLVDNSPTDALRGYASRSPKILYLHGQGNVGFGAAHNIAIRKAFEQGATYHFVLNADILFTPDVVTTLTHYMEHHPEVGMMMPKLILPSGEVQRASSLIPAPIDLIGRRFLPSWLLRKRLERFHLEATGYNIPMNVPYLTGCFLAFRCEALRKVGLFDERFFMYPEDIDITRRMHEQYQTLFYPAVSIRHEHTAASRKSLRMLWIHLTNMVKYFNKWGWIVDPKRGATNRAVLQSLHLKP